MFIFVWYNNLIKCYLFSKIGLFEVKLLFGIRKRQSKNHIELDKNNIPCHIAIIMDGNGRWAKKRGLPRTAGHGAGADTLVKIARHAYDLGVKCLTVYAFSTENWKRPEEEVNNLMNLCMKRLPQIVDLMEHRKVAVRFLGDRSRLPEPLVRMIEAEEARTEEFAKTGCFLNIALNYGGRDEIVSAVRKIAVRVKENELSPEAITEEVISSHLYTAHCPDPDLVLRPSGEIRISNFLLWQSAYSEFYYDNILWPDFSEADLERAILTYQGRSRRFGGV